MQYKNTMMLLEACTFVYTVVSELKNETLTLPKITRSILLLTHFIVLQGSHKVVNLNFRSFFSSTRCVTRKNYGTEYNPHF